MSLNNIEILGYNSLTNMSTINADEVNTDVLTKIDPDISDADFDTLEGINNTVTIQEQFDAIEAQIGNIGASYWFSAWDTTTQTNTVANTPRIVTWNNSDPASNGITSGSATGSIKVLNTNTYNIQFSFQLHQTSSSNANVTIWLRKNGNDITASAGEYDVKGNDHLVTAWNYVMVLEANDYIQFMWASNSTSMTLDYQAAQTSPYIHPAIPSVIITLTNVTGEGPAGAQGPIGPQGPRGDRGPKGDEGPAGPATDGPVAYSALALAGTANAAAIALGVVVSGQSTAIAGLNTTVTGLVGSQATQDTAIASLQAKTVYQTAAVEDFVLKTKFSSDVNVRNLLGAGDAVTLSATTENNFLRLVRTPQVIAATGTSSFHSIVSTSYIEASGIIQAGENIFINRTNNSGNKLTLYDNNAGNPYNYNGISLTYTDTSGINNIYNVSLPAGFSPSSHIFTYCDSIGSTKNILKFNKDECNMTFSNIKLRTTGNYTSKIDSTITVLGNEDDISDNSGYVSFEAKTMNIANTLSGTNVSIANVNNNTVNMGNGNNSNISIGNGSNATISIGNGDNSTTSGKIIDIGNGDNKFINIGTSTNPFADNVVTIGSDFGFVNINGIVTFKGNNFDFVNGFFSQF